MVAFLSSKRFALFLLCGLALCLVPESLGISPFFLVLCRVFLFALSINLMMCTVIQWRRLPLSVLMIHAGTLLVLLGGFVGSRGFVATVNIHEGGESVNGFRWDRGQELPLGFSLQILKINTTFYPSVFRVGAVVDGSPVQLCEVISGERVDCAGATIEVVSFDPSHVSLTLLVTSEEGKRTEVMASTSVRPPEKGRFFQLVAFRPPAIKRTWVDLAIVPEQGEPVMGTAEVNHPFHWRGLRLFHTANGMDSVGRPYAGIQIVKDGGVSLVYAGFGVFTAGIFLLFATHFFRRRRSRPAHRKDITPTPVNRPSTVNEETAP